jgi:hypothetical protein
MSEEAAMSRLTGWVLAVVLVVVVGREARAQVPESLPAYGGFGFDYGQPVPSNTYVLDRWGMLEATPMLGVALPAAPAVVERPATARPAQVGRVARSTRAVRSLSRVNTRRTIRANVEEAAPLPTGSLYWPGAVGIPVYSPAQRYASYGYGYGVSPYGTADYGAAYKGQYSGN